MDIAVRSEIHTATPETAHAVPVPLSRDDLFQTDNLLTVEERMIRDAAHVCCQEKLKPRVIGGEWHKIFNRAVMTGTGELGLLGPTLPEDDGCDAGSNLTQAGRTDGGYTPSGAKSWIAGSPNAGFFIVCANSDTYEGLT